MKFSDSNNNSRKQYEDFLRQKPDLAAKMSLEDIATHLQIPYTTLVHILYEMVVFS